MPEHNRQILFGSLRSTQRGCGDCQERRLARCLLLCLAAVICINPMVSADNNFFDRKNLILTKPFCGVYCIYTAIKLSGRQVDFTNLLQTKYIGSRKGSSLVELQKAAEDNGLYALPMGKLTSKMLRRFPHPVILHVKPDTMSREYSHYELFLGTKAGKARIFNPPEPVRLVPFQELAPRWDGNGLIVSVKPIDLDAILEPAKKRFIIYVAVAVAIVLTVHLVRRRWMAPTNIGKRLRLGFSIAQGVILAIAALLCGMIYHFANDEGLLANANATAWIQQFHQGNFIPKVSAKKVHSLLDADTVFIDARFARDFEAGHLEGAISVPVNADDNERQKTTVNIAKDARIVVYCQSAGCKFAETVAIKLMDDGFSNISIFRGGWNEWVAKNGKPKEAAL